MPQFTPKALPLSPARVRLKEAVAARVEVEQRLAAMPTVAKLDGEIAAVGPAETALARLQSASAAALLDWADAVDGSSAPAIDEVAFTDATKVLDSARASAAAASQAKASLEARYTATANAFPAIAPRENAVSFDGLGDERRCQRGHRRGHRGICAAAREGRAGGRPASRHLDIVTRWHA
jgi:hypothetical protein